MSTVKKYVCKKCNTKFSNLGNLNKHKKKTIPCVSKNVHRCKKCDHIFSCANDLKRHNNRKTPCVPEIKDTSTTISNEENKCKYCGNMLSSLYSLKRHYNSCKVKKEPQLLNDHVKKLENELLEKQAEIDRLKNSQHIQIVNNIDNRTINNDNRQININVFTFGNEDKSHVTIDDVAKTFIDYQPKEIIAKLIQQIHGDPDHPENHNVYMNDNDLDKVLVYVKSLDDRMDWQLAPLNEISKQLTTSAKSLVTLSGNIPDPNLGTTIEDLGEIDSFYKFQDVIQMEGKTVEEQEEIKNVLTTIKRLIKN